MQKLKDKIQLAWNEFSVDADLMVAKGNKAAGARSRKASLALEKLFKEWRKATVAGKVNSEQ